MDIGKTLFMILRGIKKLVMRNLSGEVTFLEFKFLKIVYQNPITQKEITDETGLTKGTVSKVLRSLERRGFVTRKRVGRKYKVEITEEGRIVIKRFEKIASEIDEILMKGFTEEEKRTLQNLLIKMLRNLEQVEDERAKRD